MNVQASDDPAEAADAEVAAVAPELRPPTVRLRDGVLVTGPWLAGASAVATALTQRLPQHTFLESDDLRPGEVPAAVVFVVSAVAPLTGSDAALLDAAAAGTDLVIGAVSKIDVHRGWRDILAADRTALAAHAPRYRTTGWVGVAAAPDLGEPVIDELAELVTAGLAAEDLPRRNRLRAWEFRLITAAAKYDDAVDGPAQSDRVAALRERREEALSQRRLARSERSIALRSQLQQARVQLSYFARNRCSSVRTELQEDAAGMTRGKLPGFAEYAGRRVGEVLVEVEHGTAAHLTDVANELRLPWSPRAEPLPPVPVIGDPPLQSLRLETRLMMLLGACFGVGVALTLSRVFADLAPGLTAVGAVVCAAIGLALTVWVVGARGLLHDRAVLDRWVGEVTGQLRTTTDQLVATRVLAAETALTGAAARREETEAADAAAQIEDIDTRLQQVAVARARARAVRDRQLPPLQRALDVVRAGLEGPSGRDRHPGEVPVEQEEGPMPADRSARDDDGLPERVDTSDWLIEDLPATADEPVAGGSAVRIDPAGAWPAPGSTGGVAAAVNGLDDAVGFEAGFEPPELDDFADGDGPMEPQQRNSANDRTI